MNDQCLGPKDTVYSVEIDFKNSCNFVHFSNPVHTVLSLAILFNKIVLIVQLKLLVTLSILVTQVSLQIRRYGKLFDIKSANELISRLFANCSASALFHAPYCTTALKNQDTLTC